MADERIRLELDLNQFTASAREGTQSLQAMAVVADQNVVPALKNVDRAADQAAVMHRNFGSTLLATSYAVQDFTSQLGTRGLAGAFAAVQNNIPTILAGLGVGSGMAGVLSIASVAAGGLASSFTKIGDEADKAVEKLKKIKEEAEKLRDSPSTKEKEAANELGSYLQSMDRKAISGGIEKVLTEQEAAKQREAIAYIAEREMVPGTEAYAARIAQRGGRRIDQQQAFDRAMSEALPGIGQRADSLLTGLAKGEAGAVDAVTAMALRRPGAFPRGLGSDLVSFSPEAEKMADLEEQAVERFGERARRGSARQRETNRLTAAGEENEQIWRNQMAEAAGLEARGGTGGLPGFGSAMMDAYRRRMQGGGFDDAAVEQARRAGALNPRFNPGVNPRTARAMANADADAIGQRMAPNAMGPGGMPMHDPRVDALMQEMETLQGLTEKTHRYISRDAQRLNRIRAKNKHLEQQSQQLNQTTLDRGR